MNKARAMLDALMGPQRDIKKDANSEDWKDKTMCKGFLLGFCPMDKSILGGKRTIEVCEKIHSEVIRSKFLEHKDGKEDSELRFKYEDYAIRDLEYVISECDAHSRREIERMRKEPRSKALPQDVNQKISQMKRESTALAQRAAALDDCEARKKEELTKQSEDLLNEAKNFEKEEEAKVAANFKPMACEVCGTAYLGQNEGEYEAHLKYKVHHSYSQVRDRLKELKDKKAERERIAKEKKDAERKKKEEEKAEKAEKRKKEKEEKGEEKDGEQKDKKEEDDAGENKKDKKERDGVKERSGDRDRRKGGGGAAAGSRSRDRGRGGKERNRDGDRERRRKDRSGSRSDRRRRSRSRRRR